MKKFLVNLIIGITLMAIGTTMLLFEVKDFRIVDGNGVFTHEKDYRVLTYDVSKNNMYITFPDDANISYEWHYNDSMKDDVRIEITKDIIYKNDEKDNTLDVLDTKYDDHERNFYDYLNTFIEGLKHKKIYVYDTTRNIIITTSYDNIDKVNIKYK